MAIYLLELLPKILTGLGCAFTRLTMVTATRYTDQSKAQIVTDVKVTVSNDERELLATQPVHPLEEFERDLDADAITAKYKEEREKRLREDGVAQFKQTEGSLAHFKADPWAAPLVREAIEKETKVLIIGGGFGGLVTAVNLKENGITDFLLVEKGGDFGGTWYWNQYPGISLRSWKFQN
jgi:hypothetical protein